MNEKPIFKEITWVAIVLGILTIVEFVISQVNSSAVWMFIIALIKSYFIVNFFMHIYRLWSDDAEGHH